MLIDGYDAGTAKLRIAHSADLGAPQDLAPLLEKPLDLLVCELAHFEPKDLFRYLKGRDIGRIVFIHMARQHRENAVLLRPSRLSAAGGTVSDEPGE